MGPVCQQMHLSLRPWPLCLFGSDGSVLGGGGCSVLRGSSWKGNGPQGVGGHAARSTRMAIGPWGLGWLGHWEPFRAGHSVS